MSDLIYVLLFARKRCDLAHFQIYGTVYAKQAKWPDIWTFGAENGDFQAEKPEYQHALVASARFTSVITSDQAQFSPMMQFMGHFVRTSPKKGMKLGQCSLYRNLRRSVAHLV